MVYSGDVMFFEHLHDMLERIESSTGSVSDVRNVQGGLFLFQSDLVSCHTITISHLPFAIYCGSA